MSSRIPAFLSVGVTHNEFQRIYAEKLINSLHEQGIILETLGRSFYSIKSPLDPIQKKMNEVFGAVILCMERYHSIEGIYKEGSLEEMIVKNQFFPTVWNHIEAAMAYQNKLPLLIMKEDKLISEGMLDSGIHQWTIVRINPKDPNEILRYPIKGFIESWIEEVKKTYYKKI